jgi:tetraprenyl-beta-curcumene synthase
VIAPDPPALSLAQLRTLGVGAGRQLAWGLPAVGAELARWRAHARRIPDATLREDALRAVAGARPLVDGAALFWILPDRRRPELLRLLVALQTLLSFLDVTLERDDDGEHSVDLVLDALDLDRPPPIEQGHDGGYLRALAQACRVGCATLPRYREAHGLLLREIRRARSFEIEHDRDGGRRSARMRELALRDFDDVRGATAWELTGGASSLLTVMAVLALAADERTTPQELRGAADAYVWVATAAALLDSYVDQFDDAISGAHNWLGYYPSRDAAVQRAATLTDRAVREVAALHHGRRHLVIVASMVAMFLSRDSARSPALRAGSETLAAHGGALTRLLIPILRAWRVAYREQAG